MLSPVGAVPTPSLIVIEPRKLIAESLTKTFRRKHWFEEIYSVSCVDEAIKLVFDCRGTPCQPRFFLFLIGGITPQKLQSGIMRIETCLPSSKIVLIDDVPRQGGDATVGDLPVRGTMSLYDSQENYCRYVEQILRESTVREAV